MENEYMLGTDTETICEETENNAINNNDSTPHASGNAANQAGSSFSPLPNATTFEEQLSIMKSRNLEVDDADFAKAKLKDLNYYRLRGYWLTLEQNESFIDGARFDDIWEIYQLDRELRKWLWEAIAPIEIKLRTQFAYYFAHLCGPDAYLNERFFWNADRFNNAIKNYVRERDRAYDHGVPYVVHNMEKYGKLPIWAAVEIMSFGTISKFYGNLSFDAGVRDGRKGVAAAVANSFGTKQRILRSWAHHLSTIRNIAAHHDRFYNRIMNIQPVLLKRDCEYASDKQFPTFLVIKRIYEKSWPEQWQSLGADLLACFERHPGVDLAPMAFPEDWRRVLELGVTK